MNHTRRGGGRGPRHYKGKHRFEHWYRVNQVYFITARCRDRARAIESPEAKRVFWERFDALTAANEFVPWVTSLLDNHYHTLGYLRRGAALPILMQRLHGSVAKLVNDLRERSGQTRLSPFWHESKSRTYFDGCIRDAKQARLAYRYTLTQANRHGIVTSHARYEHTHVNLEVERAVHRAQELNASLEGVPYKRYERREPHGD